MSNLQKVEKELKELKKELFRLYTSKQNKLDDKRLYKEDDSTYIDTEIKELDTKFIKCGNKIEELELIIDKYSRMVETTLSNIFAYTALTSASIEYTDLEERFTNFHNEETGFISQPDGVTAYDFEKVKKYVVLTDHDLSNDHIIEHLQSVYSYMHEGGFRVMDVDLVPGSFKLNVVINENNNEEGSVPTPFNPNVDYRKLIKR